MEALKGQAEQFGPQAAGQWSPKRGVHNYWGTGKNIKMLIDIYLTLLNACVLYKKLLSSERLSNSPKATQLASVSDSKAVLFTYAKSYAER